MNINETIHAESVDNLPRSSSLSIREAIFGALKSKDINGIGLIHSSDFYSTVNDLGFPKGCKVLQDILINCKIDKSGNIDFTGLEEELKNERFLHNSELSKIVPEKKVVTSTGSKAVLWKNDLYKNKITEQEHIKQVQVHKVEIQELYNKFSHGKLSADDVINRLYELNLKPTKSCCSALKQCGGSDMSFATFRTAIMSFDKIGDDYHNKPAGTSGVKKHWVDENGEICEDSVMFNARKRVDYEKRSSAQKITTDIPIKKFVKSLAMSIDSNNTLTTKFRSSSNTQSCLQPDNLPTPLLSHTQQDLYQRINTAGAEGTVRYSSEIKLQRQLIIALMRKLHAAEINMEEFQDKLDNIGIELPETLISELWRSNASGDLDVKKCIQILDADIFKSRAFGENKLSEEAEKIKIEFQEAIKSRGCNSLFELKRVFITIDTDGSKSLSLAEFKKAIRDFNIEASDDEIRLLFNYFDNSGDGTLSYDEFLLALCPSLSPSRKKLVNISFAKLDRLGERKFSLDTLIDNFNPTFHHDVLANIKTERQVTTDVINFFAHDNDSQEITYESFLSFFTFVSASIDDDKEFEDMIKNCFQLKDSKTPPPPAIPSYKSGTQKVIPRNKQAYGDIIEWQQDASESELRELKEKEKCGKKLTDQTLHRTSFQFDDQVSLKNTDLSKDKSIKFLPHVMASEYSIFSSYSASDKPIIDNNKNSQKSLLEAINEKKEKDSKRIKSLKEVLQDKMLKE